MHTVDIVVVCVALVVLLAFAATLARQQYMLRATGGLPVATLRGTRWRYGVARYTGDELRVYRAFGVGTRPTLVMRRGAVRVEGRRSPSGSELGSLPSKYVIVECRVDGGEQVIALGAGAFTGFVSWLESSAPI